MRARSMLVAMALFVAAGGCTQTMSGDNATQKPQAQPPAPMLTGTRWQLVGFQSSDDAIGTVVPPRLDRYVFDFMADGSLAMQLDCNRARGQWRQTSQSDEGGSLSISGGPMTRAACGPGAIDTQIARHVSFIRSYIIRGDRLFLALEADGGIYEFRRL